MTAQLLSIRPNSPWLQDGLAARPGLAETRLWEQPDPEAFLAAEGHRFSIVVTHGNRGLNTAEMAALSNLALVAVHGVGYDGVDLAQAEARGIRVTTTPDVLTDTVADTAVGLLYGARRRLFEADRFTRAGEWEKRPFPLARDVTGTRIGILGMGRIGAAIALRLAPIAREIAYTNRREVPGTHHRFVPDVVELARWADVLFVVVPGSAHTDGLVGAAVLEALGPQGTLVNIGRGSVVDEPALIAALQAGTLGSAGLDVFTDEPHVPEALLRLDNVALAPHVGSSTLETRQAMAELVLANIDAWLAGEPLPTPLL